MSINKALLALALGLSLAACHRGVKEDPPTVVTEKAVPYECGTPPAADPFTAQSVHWLVREVAGVKLFSLTAAMYEALMTNMVNAMSSGQQVRAQRDFYAECIARSRAPPAPATVAQPAK